jgi:hypothetical protein
MHRAFKITLAGTVFCLILQGPDIRASVAGDAINKQPLWNFFEEIFCQGEHMFACNMDNPVSCQTSSSRVGLTINFRERIVKFHGAYAGGG